MSHHGSVHPPTAELSFAGARALVVEDDPVHRRALVKTLQRLGLEVDVAENGQLALELLNTRAYPLILMDCEMPVLDGYDTAIEIRRRESARHRAVIIAVTAYPLTSVRNRILAAGIDDCVGKPIEPLAFAELLERWWIKAGPASADSSEPAEAAAAAPTSVLDPDVQRSATLVRIFLKHSPAQLEAVGAAIKANDQDALKRAAHTLKGSCLTLGLPRMASLSAALESGPANSDRLYAELTSEAERVRTYLQVPNA